MAQLIKPHSVPHHWLCKKELSIVHYNCIVSSRYFADKFEAKETIDHIIQSVKDDVRDYVSNRHKLYERTKKKTAQKYSAHLVAAAIVFLLEYRAKLDQEVLAINAVAQKIACKVLGHNQVAGDNSSLGQANKKILQEALCAYMYVPEKFLLDCIQKSSFICSIAENGDFFKPLEGKENGRLEIAILGTCITLTFNGDDTKAILNRVKALFSSRQDNEKIS